MLIEYSNNRCAVQVREVGTYTNAYQYIETLRNNPAG